MTSPLSAIFPITEDFFHGRFRRLHLLGAIVVKRILAFNAERRQEEVPLGIAPGMKASKKTVDLARKKNTAKGQ